MRILYIYIIFYYINNIILYYIMYVSCFISYVWNAMSFFSNTEFSMRSCSNNLESPDSGHCVRTGWANKTGHTFVICSNTKCGPLLSMFRHVLHILWNLSFVFVVYIIRLYLSLEPVDSFGGKSRRGPGERKKQIED